MSVAVRIVLGLAIIVVGFLIVWRTSKILEWFGPVEFAEDKFGSGGSRFFYKLLGILIVFIGIFTATNIISDILTNFAGIFAR
jgi:hypothetical protein